MALVALAKGENLPFESLCNCFEELCKPTNDRHHRERLVRKLWENFAIKEQPSFPLFRLMLPHLDTSSRPNYKLKQKGLANLYVDIMGLEKNSMEARTIVDWKRPSTGLQRSEQGNFPEVMYSVLKERCKPRADLRRVTVGEVNTMLDRLACESEKRAPMRDIHIRCTALEQKWLLRVITKDLAIGLKEEKIFKMLHPDAQELYNSVCDLKQTCDRCADPEYRLESISLELFTPVRSRLAARANWRNVDKEMIKKGPYVAEYKLDGERILMHFERSPSHEGGQKTQWWSRNNKDATTWYGEDMKPIVNRCVPLSVESVVLDGELLVYDRDTNPNINPNPNPNPEPEPDPNPDPEPDPNQVYDRDTGDFAPFGTNRSMAAGTLDGNKQPCFVVFDILWLNGRNLTQRSLTERRRELEGLVAWEDHSFELARQYAVTGGTEEMMKWLDNAMLHGYEGVMLKSLASPYVPGSRDNDWQKLKPDYVDEMGETLDLLIVAGYYGEGKKRGGDISHFLMGLRAPPEEQKRFKSEHPLFYPFCKVGTGYTQKRLAQLRDDLKDGKERWHENAPPPHLCGWKPNKTDDVPDVWFHPAKSLLMTVKAYEITASEAFLPCGITLRFPRSTAIRGRHDKHWEEAESHRRVKGIFDECKGRLASYKRRAEEVAKADTGDAGAQRGGRKGGPPKRPKVLTAVPMHLGLAEGLSKVVAVDDSFKADEAQALPQVVARTSSGGALDSQLAEVQISICELGGEVRGGDEFKMKDLTHFVICGDGNDVFTRALIRQARVAAGGCHFDIVRDTWVLDCHLARRRLPLEPRYVLLPTEATRRQMELTMDQWGDSYETLADSATLQSAMHLVREAPRDGAAAAAAVDDQLRELEHWEQVGLRTPLSILRGITAYSPTAAVRLRLRLLGAAVVAAPMAHVTHAVLAGTALADGTADALLERLRALRSDDLGDYYQARLVTEAWLAACEDQGQWLEEEPYKLRRPQIAHAESSSSRL